MPNSDPRDAFFYPTLLLMMDSYNLTHAILPRSYDQVASSCEIASLRIQGLLEAYFKINK